MKYLLLMLVCVWVWRIWFRRAKKSVDLSQTANNNAKTYVMVRCAACGVFIPQQEAIFQRKQWFCCQDHSKLG